MSIERRGGDENIPSVQRRGEKPTVPPLPKVETQVSERAEEPVPEEFKIKNPLYFALLIFMARYAGKIFMFVLLLIFAGNYFDHDNSAVGLAISSLIGIIWVIFGFMLSMIVGLCALDFWREQHNTLAEMNATPLMGLHLHLKNQMSQIIMESKRVKRLDKLDK